MYLIKHAIEDVWERKQDLPLETNLVAASRIVRGVPVDQTDRDFERRVPSRTVQKKGTEFRNSMGIPAV